MKVSGVGSREMGALLVGEVVGGVRGWQRGRGGGGRGRGGREFSEFMRGGIEGSHFDFFCYFSSQLSLFRPSFFFFLFFSFLREEVAERKGRGEGRERMKGRQIFICFLSFLFFNFIIELLWLLWLLRFL